MFGHFYLCPTSLKLVGVSWDRRHKVLPDGLGFIFCLEEVLHIDVERMFDLFLFGLKMYLNFTGVHHCFFVPTL